MIKHSRSSLGKSSVLHGKLKRIRRLHAVDFLFYFKKIKSSNQCIFHQLHKQQAKIPRKTCFPWFPFHPFSQFNFIFFEISQANPKVLLKCFWAYVILTCFLVFSRCNIKEKKLMFEIGLESVQIPPRGLPFH